jgi:hypothetical protein
MVNSVTRFVASPGFGINLCPLNDLTTRPPCVYVPIFVEEWGGRHIRQVPAVYLPENQGLRPIIYAGDKLGDARSVWVRTTESRTTPGRVAVIVFPHRHLCRIAVMTTAPRLFAKTVQWAVEAAAGRKGTEG